MDTDNQTDIHDAEEELFCDAKQARPYSQDKQSQAAEHMDGEVHGS